MAIIHLERLYKCPEQDSNGVALAKKLYQTCSTEETKKSKVEKTRPLKKQKMEITELGNLKLSQNINEYSVVKIKRYQQNVLW